MKKMISLLAVALFATTFAAGCGKFTTCDQAKSKPDCEDAKKFEEKDGKAVVTCEWEKDATDDKKSKCVTKGGPAYDDKDAKADKDACAKVNAAPTKQADCDAAVISDAGKANKKKCEFVAGPPAKCELK